MLQQNGIVNYYSHSKGIRYYRNVYVREYNSHKNTTTKPSASLPLGLIGVTNNDQEKQKQQQYYRDKILELKNFNEAFELVKSTVEAKFKMHRAGLSLILQGLPTKLGAYHVLGSYLRRYLVRISDA
jgi:hypothetical protein